MRLYTIYLYIRCKLLETFKGLRHITKLMRHMIQKALKMISRCIIMKQSNQLRIRKWHRKIVIDFFTYLLNTEDFRQYRLGANTRNSYRWRYYYNNVLENGKLKSNKSWVCNTVPLRILSISKCCRWPAPKRKTQLLFKTMSYIEALSNTVAIFKASSIIKLVTLNVCVFFWYWLIKQIQWLEWQENSYMCMKVNIRDINFSCFCKGKLHFDNHRNSVHLVDIHSRHWNK